MDLEIGIVCARCESYTKLGTSPCVVCGHSLALEPSSAAAPARGVDSSKPPPTTREDLPSGAAVVTAAAATAGVSAIAGAGASSAAPFGLEPTTNVTRDVAPASRGAFPAVSVPSPVPPAAGAGSPSSRPADSRSEPPKSSASSRGSGYSGQITPGKSTSKKSVEELMDQAKNFVCRSCSTAVPLGHKFCGRCGAAVPAEILQARTQFFGQLQAPGKAKLILIRGEGVEGLSYQLNAEQHIVGRSGQLVFPDDPFVSPKHANFFYRGGKLVVKDEGSVNGVYLRVKGTVDVQPGDLFLAGEQVFRLDATPKANDAPGPDGTYFYSSPKHQSPFRITQILQGGAPGMTVCARGNTLQIGREGGDLNFPSDLYMSAAHCKLEDSGGKLVLTDMNSRNGSYVRLKSERELSHGDYVFIGRKLLRVEITAA